MLWFNYVRNVLQVKCPLSKENNFTKCIFRKAMSIKNQDFFPNIFFHGSSMYARKVVQIKYLPTKTNNNIN